LVTQPTERIRSATSLFRRDKNVERKPGLYRGAAKMYRAIQIFGAADLKRSAERMKWPVVLQCYKI
jgi:hypothetical protein